MDQRMDQRQAFQITGDTTYGNNTLQGPAQVHNGHQIGGIYNNYHGSAHDEDRARAQKCERIRKAIFQTDPLTDRTNLIRAKGERTAGTCRWIIEDETFKAWRSGEFQVLSISGGPGRGKTMLADFLVEELSQTMAPVMYFFCLSSDPARDNMIAILRGLIYQLLLSYPRLCDAIAGDFQATERTQALVSSVDALWDLFCKLSVTHADRLTFLLDGIDECVVETQILLGKLLAKCSRDTDCAKVQFVLLSRPLPGLRRFTQVKLDPDNNQKTRDDLSLYIEAQVADLADLVTLDDKTRQSFHDEIARRAEGTFLWVGFAMRELEKQPTRSLMLETLTTMPTGLPALYSRMLSLIPCSRRSRCATIMRWVALAVRPLTLLEMCGILTKDLRGCPTVEQEIETLDAIKECGAMIGLRKAAYVSYYEARDAAPPLAALIRYRNTQRRTLANCLVLVHQSARDYLIQSPQSDHAPPYPFQISIQQDNALIMEACILCIQEEPLTKLPTALEMSLLDLRFQNSDRSHEADRGDARLWSPILEYAVRSWIQHGEAVSDSAWDYARHALIKAENDESRTQWAQALFKDHLSSWGYELPFVAVASGSQPWLRMLLGQNGAADSRCFVDFRGADQTTLLIAAVVIGNIDLVTMLLQKGANVHLRDSRDMRALDHAIDNLELRTSVNGGRILILKLLLLHGSEVNVTASAEGELFGISPLDRAIKACRVEAVRLLIANGAHVNRPLTPNEQRNSRRSSSLSRALCVQEFSLELVYTLLSAGARIGPWFERSCAKALERVVEHVSEAGFCECHDEVLQMLMLDSHAAQFKYPRRALTMLAILQPVAHQQLHETQIWRRIQTLPDKPPSRLRYPSVVDCNDT